MTVTIKEITEKFYEVIDRYEEHEDWWEESEIKPKIEYLIPFRDELEQVAVNYLEETDDTDDFVTAFAAFCTCVIRYDLVERDDWTYYDALKSIVVSMSEKIFPEYFNECDDFRELLEGICYVIVYNDYSNNEFYEKLQQLYFEWQSSILGLYLFCLFMYMYCSEPDDDKMEALKILYLHMCNDFSDYLLSKNTYKQNRDITFNEASYRRLLPFCFFASEKELMTNATLSVYETVRNRLGYEEDEQIDTQNLCKHLYNMFQSGSETDQLITCAYLYDLFAKLDTLPDTSNESSIWYNGFIDRKMYPYYKNLAMHIPTVIVPPNNFQEQFWIRMQLDKALEEKTKAMEEKKTVIRDFTHRFKNMRATSLQNVGKALLAMDDKTLKKHGRKVLLEYGVKENIIKQVEILGLRYEDQQNQLLTLLHESQSEEPDDCNDITDTINKAIVRCFTTLFFDLRDEPKLIRKKCFRDYDLITLRNSFEEEVLFLEKPDAVSWLNKNIMPVYFRFSDAWTKLYFKQDCGLDIILADLMTDLIMNALKYAVKSQTVSFDFTDEDAFMTIKTQNTSVENKDDIPGTNMGLRSQNELLHYLNSACGYDGDSIIVESLSDGLFRAEIRLSRKIFMEDR